LWFYHLVFENKKGDDRFSLSPNAFVNYKGNEGLMANPDSKHFWDHDIFTYITSISNDPSAATDTTSFKTHSMTVGDTVFYSKGFAVLENVTTRDNIPQAGFAPTDSASVASIKVYAKTGSIYNVEPLLINKGGTILSSPDTITAESLVVQLQRIKGNSIEVGLKEPEGIMKYITLKAYKFPFINVLWLGTIIMVIGFFMSALRRIQLGRPSLRKI
jgi:cytochrome c-type biogenesis protein CcmF